MNTNGRRHFCASLLGGLSTLPLAAQSFVPKQSDRPELITGDEPGFKPIFDGKTLTDWDGDPKYWRVADGLMTGEITPETVIKSKTMFLASEPRMSILPDRSVGGTCDCAV